MEELMRAINAIIDAGSVNTRGGRAWMSAEIQLSIETYVASERAKARVEWDPDAEPLVRATGFEII
jgi:hypothetical protein